MPPSQVDMGIPLIQGLEKRRGEISMKFMMGLHPRAEATTIEWAKTAEQVGFDAVGIADSQSVYQDTYICLSHAAKATSRIQLSTRVTNPVTRHPAVTAGCAATVDQISGGRMWIGIGTGQNSTVQVGLSPARLKDLREYVVAVRELLTKGTTIYKGATARFHWYHKPIPIYVAAHGPRSLELAGEIGDGVISGLGLRPVDVEFALERISTGARRAGKRVEDLDIWFLGQMHIDNSYEEALKPMLGSLASRAQELGRRPEGKNLPANMVQRLREYTERYDFNASAGERIHGGETSNTRLLHELGILDLVVEHLGIMGTGEQCLARVRQLEKLGVKGLITNTHILPDSKRTEIIRKWSESVIKRL